MTSAATVFGHFPLVLVSGPGRRGAQQHRHVLVAGMTVGTLFTLFVVPVFYSLIAATHRPRAMEEELPLEAPWRMLPEGTEERGRGWSAARGVGTWRPDPVAGGGEP